MPRNYYKFLFYLTREHRVSMHTSRQEFMVEFPKGITKYASTLSALMGFIHDDDLHNRLSRTTISQMEDLRSVIESSRESLERAVLKISEKLGVSQ